MKDSTSKEIGSYVTLALSTRKPISITNFVDSNGKPKTGKVELDLDDNVKLSSRELSHIKELLRKYNKVKKILPTGKNIDNLKFPGSNGERIETGIKHSKSEHRVIKVSDRQFDLAKEFANRVSEIDLLHNKGDDKGALKKYEELEAFSAKTRDVLFGDFQTLGEIDEVLGMPGTGSNSGPQAGFVPVLVFVGIEIWVG